MASLTSCPNRKCFSDGTYLARGGKRMTCSGFGQPFCKYADRAGAVPTGAVSSVKKVEVVSSSGDSSGVSLQSLLGIPESFDVQSVLTGGAFNCELFFHPDVKLYYSKGSLMRVQDFLMGLWTEVYTKSSMLMSSVYLFGASTLVDWRAFVWLLSVQAYNKGMSVLPSLHLSDLSALHALQASRFSKTPTSLDDVERIKQYSLLAAQGATLYLQHGHDYADYLSASMVFLFDDYSVSDDDVSILQGFIAQRAARGLPTYVFSSVDPSRRKVDPRTYLFGVGGLSTDTFSSFGSRLDVLVPLLLERRATTKSVLAPEDVFLASGDE